MLVISCVVCFSLESALLWRAALCFASCDADADDVVGFACVFPSDNASNQHIARTIVAHARMICVLSCAILFPWLADFLGEVALVCSGR